MRWRSQCVTLFRIAAKLIQFSLPLISLLSSRDCSNSNLHLCSPLRFARRVNLCSRWEITIYWAPSTSTYCVAYIYGLIFMRTFRTRDPFCQIIKSIRLWRSIFRKNDQFWGGRELPWMRGCRLHRRISFVINFITRTVSGGINPIEGWIVGCSSPFVIMSFNLNALRHPTVPFVLGLSVLPWSVRTSHPHLDWSLDGFESSNNQKPNKISHFAEHWNPETEPNYFIFYLFRVEWCERRVQFFIQLAHCY